MKHWQYNTQRNREHADICNVWCVNVTTERGRARDAMNKRGALHGNISGGFPNWKRTEKGQHQKMWPLHIHWQWVDPPLFLKSGSWVLYALYANRIASFTRIEMVYPYFCLALCMNWQLHVGQISLSLWEINNSNRKNRGSPAGIGSNSWRNGCFSPAVPGGLIFTRTSLFWVSELIPKIHPAKTLPFIWVGILCQAQHG